MRRAWEGLAGLALALALPAVLMVRGELVAMAATAAVFVTAFMLAGVLQSRRR
jgi:hypothetical protein